MKETFPPYTPVALKTNAKSISKLYRYSRWALFVTFLVLSGWALQGGGEPLGWLWHGLARRQQHKSQEKEYGWWIIQQLMPRWLNLWWLVAGYWEQFAEGTGVPFMSNFTIAPWG